MTRRFRLPQLLALATACVVSVPPVVNADQGAPTNPGAYAAPEATPARDEITAAVTESAPPPPTDVNPNVLGIQVNIPYYTEPEFLLQAGTQRWDVRNRPAGTVAAGYGHENDAIHDDLTATARFQPVGTTPATATLGTLGATRQPLDVTTVIPAELRDYTWLVTRYDDGSVEFQGQMEKGLPWRFVLGPNANSPQGYVGGTVLEDKPGTLYLLLVRSDGTLVRAQPSYPTFSLTTVGNAGAAAVAAVSRSVSAFASAPRVGSAFHDEAPTTSTLLVVWRADGQFVPVQVGIGANGVTQLAPLSTLNVNLNATPAFTPSMFDFDFDCVAAQLNTGLVPVYTGGVASYLSCPAGHDGGAAPDTVSLGRISLGIPVRPVTGPEVRVLTASDYAQGAPGGTAIFTPQPEVKVETGCIYPGQPASGVVPVGSFDLRTVLGVTHLGCVEPSSDSVKVSEYLQPKNAVAWQLSADPLGRTAEKTVGTRALKRTTFDRMYEPVPGDGNVPLSHLTYQAISQPTIQIQFPCAHLLARPVRTGLLLDDCDTSTNPPVLPPGIQIAPPPPNWISYTVGAYATIPVDNQPQRRLVVTTVPGALPLDRTYANTTTPSPFGTYAGADNFSLTIEPSPYLASDLTKLLSQPGVDVTAFSVYQVPAQNQPRLLLAQIVRPARTTVELSLTDTTPHLEVSPTVPIAVLQAPPQAGGMYQDAEFTPSFAQSTMQGQAEETGRSTNLGAHVGYEATATVGVGAGGNNVRGGGGTSVEFQFNNEVEQSLEQSVSVENGGTYGGLFDDHTIVTRAIEEWVWPGTILNDPTGLAAGQPASYRVPDQQLIDQAPLSQLAQDEPGLYGPNGLFGKSLERIVGYTVIGDPGSYLSGAASSKPTSILAANGGPCKGAHTATGTPTQFTGDLPKAVSPQNPFYDKAPPIPTEPNIIPSAQFHAGIDSAMDSADIGITSETTSSTVTSLSYDFSLSAIGKFEAEVDAGVSAQLELTVTAGADAGWGTTAGITDTLGTTSAIHADVQGIPYGGDAFKAWRDANPWVYKEQYDWRMFFCKAQLGPVGLGHEVWVQGFVTANYAGVGGLDELAAIALTSPENEALVRATTSSAIPTGSASACTGGPNEFAWIQDEGTVKRYSTKFVDTVTGSPRTRLIQAWTDPADFIDHVQRNADDDRPGVVPRPSCAKVDPGAFTDGQYYEASLVADGFLPGQSVSSDPITVHAEVWPPDQQLTLLTPIVAADGTTQIWIEDPAGVRSLEHNVTIRRVGDQDVVEMGEAGYVDPKYRYVTGPLEPGTYEATVVGYNDHVLQGGGRAETPAATVQFTYDPSALVSQWTYDCGHSDCTVDDTIKFTDESTAGSATITKWAWDFGDGSTSTQPSPTHRFAAPSSGDGYLVKLRVTDSAGRTDSLGQKLVVGVSRLPNLAVSNAKVYEKKAPTYASFKVTLSKSSDQAVNVTYATANGTATAGKDYKAITGSVTFAPGQTVKIVKVRVLQDSRHERTETFKLRLKASSARVNLVDLTGVCKIIDND